MTHFKRALRLTGALLLAACSSTSFHLMGRIPAVGTDGRVKVDTIEGGNHLVTIDTARPSEMVIVRRRMRPDRS